MKVGDYCFFKTDKDPFLLGQIVALVDTEYSKIKMYGHKTRAKTQMQTNEYINNYWFPTDKATAKKYLAERKIR